MKRAWLIILLVLIAAAAISYLLYSRARFSASRVQTPLGEFELLDITIAGQPLREGSPLQHLSETINSKDLGLGSFGISPPTRHKDNNDAPMTAWLLYRGNTLTMTPRAGASPRWFEARVLVVDSAGNEYKNGFPYLRRSTADEKLLSLPIDAFPKDQPHFLLRFSPPPMRGTNREWIEFRAQNPLYEVAFNWPTNSVPQTNEVNGIPIVLREVTLRPASCLFEVWAPHWSVEKCTLEDANGNLHTATRRLERIKPEHTLLTCGFQQNLDTNQSWRIHLSLRNLVNLPTESHRLLHLSSNAPPKSITNQTGHVFACSFDGTTLSITAPADETILSFGWILRGATNSTTAEKLALPPYATSHPIPNRPFSQTWPALSEPCSDLTVQLAFPTTIQTEFQLR